MALYLTEQDVEQLLTMPEAVEALDGAFGRQAYGEIINQPRQRLFVPQGSYQTMVAADLGLDLFAIKTYTVFRPHTRFLMLLYSAQSGDLLAMIEADRMGQMRTGAASGVATRYMAQQGWPLEVGIYGTGWQAESQLEAISAVREIARITAYGRDPERRAGFCARMAQKLGVEVIPADKPELAADGKDVVITATTASSPVLQGEWLKQGAHINAIGSNMMTRREVDEETIKRAAVLVVDSIEQSKFEAGDLIVPFERRLFRWEQVAELKDVVGGSHPGRTSADQITFFKSLGIAMEDVAVAAIVYRKARTQKVGTEMGMWGKAGK